MNIIILLSSAIISLLIGVIFALIDNSVKNEQSPIAKIFRVVEKSLIYGILGLALTTTISTIVSMFTINDTLIKLDECLKESNKLYVAQESINQIESPTVKTLFNRGLDRITNQLEDVPLKKMYVPRERILTVWEYLIKNSEIEILATNLISKEDWKHLSQDGTGLELQEKAINQRKVEIKRIFIYDGEEIEHIVGLYNLAKMQANIGVDVKFILKTTIESNASVQDDLRQMQHILDIVIADKQSIFLTEIEFSTYMMKWSELRYDAKTIECGVHFWERAWDMAMTLGSFEEKYSETIKQYSKK